MQTTVTPHYLEAGSGPPLLLLHGLFDSSGTWVRLIPYLSAQFKVYAIDLPGFGKTPLPDDWGESLSSMVDTVIGFLDQREISQISLIGSSMGGGVITCGRGALPFSHPENRPFESLRLACGPFGCSKRKTADFKPSAPVFAFPVRHETMREGDILALAF